jgi:hypothetical protein
VASWADILTSLIEENRLFKGLLSWGVITALLKVTNWSALFKNWNRSYVEKRESRSKWKVWQILIPL